MNIYQFGFWYSDRYGDPFPPFRRTSINTHQLPFLLSGHPAPRLKEEEAHALCVEPPVCLQLEKTSIPADRTYLTMILKALKPTNGGFSRSELSGSYFLFANKQTLAALRRLEGVRLHFSRRHKNVIGPPVARDWGTRPRTMQKVPDG